MIILQVKFFKDMSKYLSIKSIRIKYHTLFILLMKISIQNYIYTKIY